MGGRVGEEGSVCATLQQVGSYLLYNEIIS